MKLLSSIELPKPGNSETVCIFYSTITLKKVYEPGEPFPVDAEEKDRSKHCEMFCKSDLSSVTFNPASFFLRFKKRSGAKDIKIHFAEPSQVQELAELMQYRFEKGLQVKEFYADISIREIVTA